MGFLSQLPYDAIMHKIRHILLASTLLSLAVPAYAQTPTPAVPVNIIKSEKAQFTIQTITNKLENPWALAVLPEGRLLVTERPGRMRIVSTQGQLSAPLANLPRVFNDGQGGLLDVILDPDFASNKTIYFSYAEAEGKKAGTTVAKAELTETSLQNVQIIFRQQPRVEGGNHFGSRLAIAPDGKLFIGLGVRFNYAEKAQTLDNHMGKVVRINTDASVPSDNPYTATTANLPEIWSHGHRNIQGAAIHPQTGQLWVHEHGPKGGDEINIPQPGKNYGWPKASYGSHYSMLPIPDEHAGKGFEEPAHSWNPSIAPSGMMFYTGAMFPQWKNNLFVGALAGQHVARLEMAGKKVMHEERLLTTLDARIRDVRQATDGSIYLLTDEDNGRILRLVVAP